MNESKNNISKDLQLNVLYTNIGRGHPFYLDGIMETMINQGTIDLVKSEKDVFEISQGKALYAWKTARWMYKHSSSGILRRLYSLIRSNRDYNQRNRLMTIMGRDILCHFDNVNALLLVAHPLLVGILAGRNRLVYQHGEMVMPSEALVLGADTVFVPTQNVADKFISAGYKSNEVVVTGLCIEPSLVCQANDAFDIRKQRFQKNEPLTGVFFSSGAEPSVHVHKLVTAVLSVLKNNGKAIIIAQHGGKLDRAIRTAFRTVRFNLKIINSADIIPSDLPVSGQTGLPKTLLVLYNSRREENSSTAHFFKSFDYLVAPAHERTNWAMGLGLPMFIVDPAIGPYAPLNAELLVQSGVGEILNAEIDCQQLGVCVRRYHSNGRLLEMAERGRSRDIDGFLRIANYLISKYDE
ncbi:MAG: hypothetical protein U9N55_04790 [candidate division Zixibacteria bacterium]|nr:hypothetical protein [candidate division Zixibacteria bacterium]